MWSFSDEERKRVRERRRRSRSRSTRRSKSLSPSYERPENGKGDREAGRRSVKENNGAFGYAKLIKGYDEMVRDGSTVRVYLLPEFQFVQVFLAGIQGNIARWLKKDGDKVSPEEVLCEVETDKATVEMECMEEGYLAKIVRRDGSQGIQVGKIIAITVEEEEDIATG